MTTDPVCEGIGVFNKYPSLESELRLMVECTELVQTVCPTTRVQCTNSGEFCYQAEAPKKHPEFFKICGMEQKWPQIISLDSGASV